jgi:hypothetical protein
VGGCVFSKWSIACGERLRAGYVGTKFRRDE